MDKLISRFFVVSFILVFFLGTASASFAQGGPTLHFFWAEGCPHCEHEKKFLDAYNINNPQLRVMDYEITKNQENVLLLQKVAEKLNVQVNGVPFTVVGTQYIAGYATDETTGTQIESLITRATNEQWEDVVSNLAGIKERREPTPTVTQISDLTLPFLGTVNIKNLSLPVITILIAALDGFNPCAMWTLIFLIGLLLGMKDQKRMWIYGFTFIAGSAIVYFLFMSAWLNLFLFIGFITAVRLVIAIVALGGGILNLREYLQNKDANCKVTNVQERKHFFERMKRATHERSFLVGMGAILVLAFAVNLVELVCSAGLPAVYTQILSMSNLPSWAYYSYLILYILIFMLDDLFVFVISMKTLQVAGVTTKYSRVSHLVGGLVMIAIGCILLLRPELLMFG